MYRHFDELDVLKSDISSIFGSAPLALAVADESEPSRTPQRFSIVSQAFDSLPYFTLYFSTKTLTAASAATWFGAREISSKYASFSAALRERPRPVSLQFYSLVQPAWKDLQNAVANRRFGPSVGRQDAAQYARHTDLGSRNTPRLADQPRQTVDRHIHKSTSDRFRFSPSPAPAQSFRHRGSVRPRKREP